MYILVHLEFVQGADYESQYLHVLSLIEPTGNSEIIKSTLHLNATLVSLLV